MKKQLQKAHLDFLLTCKSNIDLFALKNNITKLQAIAILEVAKQVYEEPIILKC